jgi:hypothetical protein
MCATSVVEQVGEIRSGFDKNKSIIALAIDGGSEDELYEALQVLRSNA